MNGNGSGNRNGNRNRNRNRNRLSSGWKGSSAYILFVRRRGYPFSGLCDNPFNIRLSNDLFNRLRDSNLNSFRDDNLVRFAATLCIVVFSRRFCRTYFCSYKWRRRFALANRCRDVIGHRLSFGACFEIARNTLRGLRFRGTHLGGLIK
jgi:hypothetical protein